MSNEEMEELYNKLSQIDSDLANGLLSAKDPYQYLRDIEPSLEGNSDYTDVYSNLGDFIGDRNSRLSKLYKELNGKKPTVARMNSFLDKNSDISAKDVNDWFDKTNYWKDYETKVREQEAGKIRRQREIEGRLIGEDRKKNWGFLQNILASDYAKQRYINEPETALIGAEAPAIGEAPRTRTAAALDVGAGALGAAADFVPPIWWAGPAIRTGRDIAYYGSGSPYAKDLKEIGASAGMDFGINRAARMLPNARREARIARQNLTQEAARTAQAEAMMGNISRDLEKINGQVLLGTDDAALTNIIESMSESPMKEDLMALVRESNLSRPINRDAVSKVIANYQAQSSKPVQDYARMLKRGEATVSPKSAGFYKDAKALNQIANSKPFKELGFKDKASYLYSKLANQVNTGALGQVGIQQGANIPGRGVGTVKYDNYEEFERQKEMMKQLHAKDWLTFGSAFAPAKRDGDPAWEAYKEVMGIE